MAVEQLNSPRAPGRASVVRVIHVRTLARELHRPVEPALFCNAGGSALAIGLMAHILSVPDGT